MRPLTQGTQRKAEDGEASGRRTRGEGQRPATADGDRKGDRRTGGGGGNGIPELIDRGGLRPVDNPSEGVAGPCPAPSPGCVTSVIPL
jgi:hypothetical protein